MPPPIDCKQRMLLYRAFREALVEAVSTGCSLPFSTFGEFKPIRVNPGRPSEKMMILFQTGPEGKAVLAGMLPGLPHAGSTETAASVARLAGVEVSMAAAFLDDEANTMAAALRRGEGVFLPNVGSIEVSRRTELWGKPISLDAMKTPPVTSIPVFRPLDTMMELLNRKA